MCNILQKQCNPGVAAKGNSLFVTRSGFVGKDKHLFLREIRSE